jgi:NAD(P)-dependent dehydrogenase (short-subunit alcohol dehydrogenase family)
MDTLNGRVVLITGGSQGLGAELARAFADAGARVAICARDQEMLDEVSAAIVSRGGECLALPADVTREAQVRRWVDAAFTRWGRIDVLVNNASLLGPRAPFTEYPLAEWRRVVDVNLNGAAIATSCALPYLLRVERAAILNVSSGAAVPPRRSWGAYAVSKTALDAFSANLAAELATTNVRVHTVNPGALRTSMRASAYPEEDPRTIKPPAAATAVFLWAATSPPDLRSGERLDADDFRADT